MPIFKLVTITGSINMADSYSTQSVSFKVWILNYLLKNRGSADILQLANDFDKAIQDFEGFDRLCLRLNTSSFKNLIEQNYRGLIELDDDQLFLLKSGEVTLCDLLRNCRSCSRTSSKDGYCVQHAVANLKNWNYRNENIGLSQKSDKKNIVSNNSKSEDADIVCISSASEYSHEKQCFAFRVWFLNLLSKHEALNVGEVGGKFKNEIKKVNWLKQFNYPKLTLLVSRELSDLISEKNNVYKMTEKGKQMLIQLISNCCKCYPGKSGLCDKHAKESLCNWSEDKVASSDVGKQKKNSLSDSSSSSLNTSFTNLPIIQEPPLITCFKVWLLELLRNKNLPVLDSNVKAELENSLGQKVDFNMMFQVRDISELISETTILKDFIYYSSNMLHLTLLGKKHLEQLVNNCFYCNTGSEGTCISHAIESFKKWKPPSVINRNSSLTSLNKFDDDLPDSLQSTSLSKLTGEPYITCLHLISWILAEFGSQEMHLGSLRKIFFKCTKKTDKWLSQFNARNMEDFFKNYMSNLYSINTNSLYKLTSQGLNVRKFFSQNCKECLKNKALYLCGLHAKNIISSQSSNSTVLCTIDLSKDDKTPDKLPPTKSHPPTHSNIQKNSHSSDANNTYTNYPKPLMGNKLDFPTLEEARNSSSRQIPFNSKSSGPRIRPMSELQEYEALEMPKISSKDTQYLSREHINSIAQDCIQQLAELNEHVSVPKIISCLLNRFQVSSLNMLNSSLRRPEDIECISKHSRDLCRINGYIQAFLTVRSIATVYELYECLKEYNYDTLQLGPFIRLPALYDYFKIPNELKDIPHIESKDIIITLKEYLTASKKWCGQVSLPEFLEYLCKQYNARSAFELGIQIKSVPLAIQVLKKAQRDEWILKEKTDKQMNSIFEKEMTIYIENFRRHLTECSSNLKVLQKNLYTRPVIEVLNDLLEMYEIMITGLLDEKRKKLYKTQLRAFRSTFKSDVVLAHLFTLAVLCAIDENIENVMERIHLTLLGKALPAKPVSKKPAKEEPPKNLPSESEVINIVKDYFQKMLEKGQLTLKHLSQIETKIAEKFETTFEKLGCGTFLECLIQQPHLLQMLDEAGCGSLGLSSNSSGDSKHHYLPSFQEILSFLHQCDSSLTQEMLAAALCAYYGVSDVKFFNYGNINRLLKSAKPDTAAVRQPSNIIYEMAITTVASSHWEVKKTVGLLGSKTVEEALNCLENCPLLEDLKIWSHWDLVFKPELGDMKQFIHKYGYGSRHGGIRRNPLLVLEIEPGKILKLTNDASDELFSKAACEGDIHNTCGQLVSLIALNGVQNSLALWSTRIKIALVTIYQREMEKSDSDSNPDLTVCQFVIGCLMQIPRRICLAVATKVFLDPLSTFGANQSKQLLLQCCSTPQEFSLLQELGMVLVIQEWAENFSEKLTLNQQYSFVEDDIKETLQEESSDDELEESLEGDSEESDDSIEESIDSSIEKPEEKLTVEIKKDLTADDKVEDTERLKDIGNEVETINPCKIIIDTIRKEEFGVGLVLTGEAKALLRSHEERLGRSLDRLSKDLYSKDTHFVLELIQNADDNSYPIEYFDKDGKIEPAIKLILQTDRIIILNNECGFLEKHVKALCDVGKSTKGKHLAGYIGQKGIGFKSVFRISDKPEIHSAGFHFRFDVNSGPMGYIMPHWIEDDDPQESWNTKIILPLKPEFQNLMTLRSLLAQFQDIHSSLLIFLHRLRSITIENKIDNNFMYMSRKDLTSNLIELNTQESKCQWLVIRKVLDASKISAQMKAHGGVEVEATELALAFPLFSLEEKKINLKVMPPKQKVFAFLPLRSYGFRFILQGDFEVPSSREDIDTDSPWNQWLRNEVNILFCESMQYFQDLPHLNALEAICYFLQFVPFEDEILDFFRPVTSGIYKLLRAKACLPVVGTDGKSVEWKVPLQVVIPSDPFIQEVISPSILKRTLDFYYIHPQVLENISLTLVMSLGVQKLDTSHLISIGVCLATDLKQIKVTSDILTIISNWLICLYRSLEDVHQENILDPVKSIAIIPLANGQLISIMDDNIFFPVKLANLHEQEKRVVSLIEKELSVIHPELINCSESIKRSQITKLLEKLGMKHIVPKEIITSHIIPTFKSDSWKVKSQDVLIAYVVYIKQQLSRVKHMISVDELKSVIQVSTNQGFKNPFKESVHFSKDYANPVDLALKLPGIQWTLLDRNYLKFSTFDGILEWRTFFTEFGVLDSLAVKKCTITHNAKTLKTSVWNSFSDSWPICEAYIIKDWVCEQFLDLISKNQSSTTLCEQMSVLAEVLDANWNTHYLKALTAEVCNSDDQVMCTTESSFSLALKQSTWLPGLQISSFVLDNDSVKLIESSELWNAADLFKPSDEARELLHIHVPYLKASLSNHSVFAQHLNLKEFVTVDLIKKLLLSWCERKNDIPTIFNTSLAHMEAVYRYLWKKSTHDDLQELFMNYPIIFVPVLNSSDFTSTVCGNFLTKDEVFWNEPSGILSKYNSEFKTIHIRKSLYEYYPDLERIFFEAASVTQHPNMVEYVAILEHISTIFRHSRIKVSDVMKIYQLMYVEFIVKSSSDISLTKIRKILSNHHIFLTTAKLWVTLEKHPMIADNKEFVELFQNENDVYLLDFSQQKEGRIRDAEITEDLQKVVMNFFKACGIEKISECVIPDFRTEFYQPCPSMQQFVHSVIPYVQTFFWNKLPDIYTKLKESKIKGQLSIMRFAQVKKLHVVYTLKHKPNVPVVKDEKCTLINNRDLYIQESFRDNHHLICSQLVLMFIRGNPEASHQLRLFLTGLAPAILGHCRESPDEFMENQNYKPLPDDEETWAIPLPLYQIPSVIAPVVATPSAPEPLEKQPKKQDGGNQLRCWPPPDPRRGRSSLPVKENNESQDSEKPNWPRVPTPPPDYQKDDRDAASNDTQENLPQKNDMTPHRISEFKENIPSQNADATERDSISPSSYKRKRQLDNDNAENKMPRVSQNDHMSRPSNEENARRVRGDNYKNNRRDSSQPNDQRKFSQNQDRNLPQNDDSVVLFDEREGSGYMKIYHPRPKIRQYPLNNVEVEFEELAMGKKLEVPKIFESDNLEDRISVGRYGEALVNDFLRSSFYYPGSNLRISFVEWVNEKTESEFPFDIKAVLENGIEVFIEVKTTKSNHKEVFEISIQEVQFAQTQKDCYHLFRVYNAGNQDKVRLVFLRDLSTKLEYHSVKLCMVI